MRPKNFPRASDFKIAVQTKRDLGLRFQIETQLNAISNCLTNFHERCNSNGDLIVEAKSIGMKIYPENQNVLAESGWNVKFLDNEKYWVFSIKELN